VSDERPWSVLRDRQDWDERDEQAEWEREVASRRRERRMLGWLVVVVLLVVGGIYAVGWAWTADKLPRGTTVAGVDVGGLGPRAAEQRLSSDLRSRLQAPVRVQVADQEFAIDPQEAGLDVDVPASIAQVPVGRSGNPADMWENVVGGDDYPAVTVTVGDGLEARLRRIADQVGTPATEGAVRFTVQGAEPVYPASGETLDVRTAATVVAGSFLSSDEPVLLTLDKVTPRVSARAVSTAMRRVANPATSGPVVYRFGGREVVVRPDDLAVFLSMQRRGARLVPRLDEDAFARFVEPQVAPIERAPRDARVVARGGRLRVVPAVDGREVDVRAMADTFLTLATADGAERSVTMTLRPVRPEVTTARAERQRDRMRAREASDRAGRP
jgi:hypothetical protein